MEDAYEAIHFCTEPIAGDELLKVRDSDGQQNTGNGERYHQLDEGEAHLPGFVADEPVNQTGLLTAPEAHDATKVY